MATASSWRGIGGSPWLRAAGPWWSRWIASRVRPGISTAASASSRTKAWSADREISKDSSVSVPALVAGVGRSVVVTAVVRADDTVEDHVKLSDHIGDDADLVEVGAMIQTS
jgi:hypothetical protein